MGKPVVPFGSIQDQFPANEYDLFVALSYKEMNELRKIKYMEGKKNKGWSRYFQRQKLKNIPSIY